MELIASIEEDRQANARVNDDALLLTRPEKDEGDTDLERGRDGGCLRSRGPTARPPPGNWPALAIAYTTRVRSKT